MHDTSAQPKHQAIRYEVEGRNGYYAIDAYRGTACMRTVSTFRTRKQADEIQRELTHLAELVNVFVFGL